MSVYPVETGVPVVRRIFSSPVEASAKSIPLTYCELTVASTVYSRAESLPPVSRGRESEPTSAPPLRRQSASAETGR